MQEVWVEAGHTLEAQQAQQEENKKAPSAAAVPAEVENTDVEYYPFFLSALEPAGLAVVVAAAVLVVVSVMLYPAVAAVVVVVAVEVELGG